MCIISKIFYVEIYRDIFELSMLSVIMDKKIIDKKVK